MDSDKIAEDIKSRVGTSVASEYVKSCVSRFHNTMESLIVDGANANRELGMLFCGCHKQHCECSIGKMCSGTACTVSLRDCAPHDEIGSFHTHPGTASADPSAPDVLSAIMGKHKFSCIGSTKDGIRCYSIIWQSKNTIDAQHLLKDLMVITALVAPVVEDCAKELLRKGLAVGWYEKTLQDVVGVKIVLPIEWSGGIISLAYEVAKSVAIQDGRDEHVAKQLRDLEPDMDKYHKIQDKTRVHIDNNYKDMYFEHNLS